MTAVSSRAAPLSREDRRAAIVASTAPLVRRHGRAVTTRQIAAAAGIAEGTIFRVFADKGELIDSVVHEELDEGPLLVALAAVSLDLPLRERLVAAATLMRGRMQRITQLMVMLHSTGGPPVRHAAGGPRPRRDGGGSRAEVRRLLEPDAEALSVELDRAAGLFTGLLWATSRTVPEDGGALAAEDVVDCLLYGMLRPSGGGEGD